MISYSPCSSLFFFNDTATTEIYTLSLHDALPISFKLCSNYFSNYPFLAGRERQIVRCFQSPVQVSGRQGLPKASPDDCAWYSPCRARGPLLASVANS